MIVGQVGAQQAGIPVVMFNVQPPVILPLSLSASSTMYSDQTPLPETPLNAESEAEYGPIGAGEAKVSVIPP